MIFHSYNLFHKIKIKNDLVLKDQLLFKKIVESNHEANLLLYNKFEPNLLRECDSVYLPYEKKIIYPDKINNQIIKIEESNKFKIFKDISPLRIISKKTKNKDTDNILFLLNSFCFNEKNIIFDTSYNRWAYLKKKYNLNVKDYHYPGDDVLLLLQVESDASLNYFNFGKVSYRNFLKNKIKAILEQTDRKIIIRGHPANKWKEKVLPFLLENFKDTNRVYSSMHDDLEADFKKSYCAVSYNSSATIEALLFGLNVINLSKDNPCLSAASNNLEDIENPKELNRENALRKLSFLHWEKEELDSKDIQRLIWQLIKKKILTKKNDY